MTDEGGELDDAPGEDEPDAKEEVLQQEATLEAPGEQHDSDGTAPPPPPPSTPPAPCSEEPVPPPPTPHEVARRPEILKWPCLSDSRWLRDQKPRRKCVRLRTTEGQSSTITFQCADDDAPIFIDAPTGSQWP